MRVLVVKTSSLGDVIHMLPALTDAVRAVPALEVDWVVEEGFSAVPAWHPHVNRVFEVSLRRWKKKPWVGAHWQALWALSKSLRGPPYTCVLDTQGLLKSAFWAAQAQGPVAGYAFGSAREPLASLFYRQRYSVERRLHAIERNRQLTALALGYACPSTRPDHGLTELALRLQKTGRAVRETEGLRAGPYVLGFHGTSRENKEWPASHWAYIAQALAQRACPLYLPQGNPREAQRAHTIAQQAPGTQVLPPLSLDALALLTAQAQAVVGVDTGLMHLAAALGKPGLALYTATEPGLTGVVHDARASAPLDNLSEPAALTPENVLFALLQRLPAR